MIWSIWLALALGLALASRGPARAVFLFAFAGLAAMQIIGAATPPSWRYVASAAVWVSVGAATINRGFPLPAAGFVASGLCYAVAQVFAAPQQIGVPIRVLADLFGVVALVGVWFGRDTGLCDPRRPDPGRGHHIPAPSAQTIESP